MFALDFPIANEFIEEPLYKKKAHLAGALFFGTGWTRVELATSDVTGRCSNQLSYHPNFELSNLMGNTGFEPMTRCV